MREEKFLKDEARAHLATVVRLDPKHAEAWKKLGYKKSGERWVTDAQASTEKTEKQAQQDADKRWQPRLERIKADLANPKLRDAAERSLAEVSDPRASATIWKVFVLKADQKHGSLRLKARPDARTRPDRRARARIVIGSWRPWPRRPLDRVPPLRL